MPRSEKQALNIRDTGWKKVSSSNVKRIRHIGSPVNQLYVQFHNGATYVYDGVDADTYYRMWRAASKGRFVWRVLRGGRVANPPYEATKL